MQSQTSTVSKTTAGSNDVAASDASSSAEYARINAIAATDALTETLDGFREKLTRCCVDARAYRIPTQTLSDDTPPTAPVIELVGQEATEVAIRALLRTAYGDDQHSKATVRLPGIIRVNQDMSDTVGAVNQVKDNLKGAMKALGYAAWLQWRGQIPAWQRLNKLQAYREWRWIAEPMVRINFTWAGHNVGGEQLRIAALIERLKDQYERYGITAVESEIDRLEGFDGDEVVVIRRPVAPTPIANIRFADGSKRAVKTALPFITAHPLPAIGPLTAFDPNKRNARRNDLTTEMTPLDAHLHVYRYMPASRFRLRADPTPVRMQWVDEGIEVRGTAKASRTIVLPVPNSGRLELFVQVARQTRGPTAQTVGLSNDGGPVLVAANVANAFLDADGHGVWRVPIKDLVTLADWKD